MARPRKFVRVAFCLDGSLRIAQSDYSYKGSERNPVFDRSKEEFYVFENGKRRYFQKDGSTRDEPGYEPDSWTVEGLSLKSKKSNGMFYSIEDGKRRYWGRDVTRAVKAYCRHAKTAITDEEKWAWKSLQNIRNKFAEEVEQEWTDEHYQNALIWLETNRHPDGHELTGPQRYYLKLAIQAYENKDITIEEKLNAESNE